MILSEGPVSLAVEPYKPSSRRRVRRAQAESLIKTLATAILGFLVLLCAGLLVPVLWSVAVDSTEPKSRSCDTIKSAAERLPCFEKQRGGALPLRDQHAIVPPGLGQSGLI